jgi:putative nucleotidyltransferase with HDIG domain
MTKRLPCNHVEGDVELSYDSALATSCKCNRNESLVKHGIAVGAATAASARAFGEDENKWRVAGLPHAVDYEKRSTFEEHGKIGADWLRGLGYPDDVVHAVPLYTDYHGAPRDYLLAKRMFACDELTSLRTACAPVRPDKSLSGLEVSLVRKKMKDKAFARVVKREDIVKGAHDLGVDLDQHIAFVIAAMPEEAGALGLAGNAS